MFVFFLASVLELWLIVCFYLVSLLFSVYVVCLFVEPFGFLFECRLSFKIYLLGYRRTALY